LVRHAPGVELSKGAKAAANALHARLVFAGALIPAAVGWVRRIRKNDPTRIR
jgi:hypothetical protein